MKRPSKLFKTRSIKQGLPPGSLVHIGEPSDDAVTISVFEYQEHEVKEHHYEHLDSGLPTSGKGAVTWIDVEGVHQVETIRCLGASYNLHPLVLEDIVSTVQRPKVEDYDDYLFVVVKMLLPLPEGDFTSEQLSLVLGRDYVLTFQEGIQGDVFEPVRERDDTTLIRDTTRLFMRDVHDHAVQTIETVETYRDLLSGMLDLYLSSLGNRTNEIMKFLTIIGTIFIPLTFIVGVYGMNFKNMPELEWHYGYFFVLGLMVLITIGMVIYFKRRKWL